LFVPVSIGLTFEIFLSEESLLYLFGYLRSQGWKRGTMVINIDGQAINEDENMDRVILDIDKPSGESLTD